MQGDLVSLATNAMTPAARVQAAIEILDRILDGEAAEKALTGWARRSRFAGSKDRAAIRDFVFSALRQRRSFGWIGGANTGRGLMLGFARSHDLELEDLFTGAKHAPQPLNETEKQAIQDVSGAASPIRLDVPDWLWPHLEQSLGKATEDVLKALQTRAPIHLRTNSLKTTREALQARLNEEGVASTPHGLAATALEVNTPTRGLANTGAFKEGLFELQDAASQAVVDRIAELISGATVLDYCAGGGGKTLAMAAHGPRRLVAHDAIPGRMKDIPIRSSRAAASVEIISKPIDKFDLVLCDAPCSGSGAWRRQPAAKWDLTRDRLQALITLQQDILNTAAQNVRPGGHMAYATCSLLDDENSQQITKFLGNNSDWQEVDRLRLTPLDGGDGFFASVLRRKV